MIDENSYLLKLGISTTQNCKMFDFKGKIENKFQERCWGNFDLGTRVAVLHAGLLVTEIKALLWVPHLWSEGSWHHSKPLQICSSLLSCNLHPGPVSLLL